MAEKMVGAYLEQGQWRELDAIKAYHGIKANADAVRFLIRQEARRIRDAAPLFSEQATDGTGKNHD